MSLVYVILFYFTFLLFFLCFIGLWKKRKHYGSLGLNGQEFGSARSWWRRSWSLRQRSSAGDLWSCAPVFERPRQGSNAPAFVRERQRSIVVRLSAPMREAYSSRSPIMEILGFRVLWILVAQGFNPTIFRVSRILLESINRPINTEKWTRYFGEELTALKEAIFWVYSFPLFYFMKMISINIMCN